MSSWSATRVRKLTGSANKLTKKEKGGEKDTTRATPTRMVSHSVSSGTISPMAEQNDDGETTGDTSQMKGRRSNTEAKKIVSKSSNKAQHEKLPSPRAVQPTRARPRGLSKSRSMPKIRRDVRQSVMRDQYGFAVESATGCSEGNTAPVVSESPRTTGFRARVPLTKVHKVLVKQERKWEMLLLEDKTAEGRLDRNRARKLLLHYNGVIPHLRGLFWQLAAGAKSRPDRQEIRYGDLCRALPPEHESVHLQQIDKDLGRTFPNNRAFTKEEGVAALRRVLLVYSHFNETVGYCQSMNFVCALFLLFMSEQEVFWLMAQVVDHVLPPAYYSPNMEGAYADQGVLCSLIAKKLPRVHAHLQKLSIRIDTYSLRWYMTCFVTHLPLESTLRFFDFFLFDGSIMLHRVTLALLKLNARALLRTTSFEEASAILRDLPKSDVDPRVLISTAFSFSIKPEKLQLLRIEHLEASLVRLQLQERMREKNSEKYAAIDAAIAAASAANNSTSNSPPSCVQDAATPQVDSTPTENSCAPLAKDKVGDDDKEGVDKEGDDDDDDSVHDEFLHSDDESLGDLIDDTYSSENEEDEEDVGDEEYQYEDHDEVDAVYSAEKSKEGRIVGPGHKALSRTSTAPAYSKDWSYAATPPRRSSNAPAQPLDPSLLGSRLTQNTASKLKIPPRLVLSQQGQSSADAVDESSLAAPSTASTSASPAGEPSALLPPPLYLSGGIEDDDAFPEPELPILQRTPRSARSPRTDEEMLQHRMQQLESQSTHTTDKRNPLENAPSNKKKKGTKGVPPRESAEMSFLPPGLLDPRFSQRFSSLAYFTGQFSDRASRGFL
eukprot:CAMPEP_0177665944 /NCGR_PEP_ID=MMETSP0447-20121125/21322_1 /TAXON_ID=0 /ORGANISM="Stygamoeba regulata, Strain BSH-02190019" /LENGTH=832 /DNA_ID=CAMNT_0019172067 /DNA_START=35 /DNA_END=2533 /DNA_ORIENTATION=-